MYAVFVPTVDVHTVSMAKKTFNFEENYSFQQFNYSPPTSSLPHRLQEYLNNLIL